MFRKSGKKPRGAIRAGGGDHRNVSAGGTGTKLSVAPSCLPVIGDAISPFINPQAGNSANADELVRSFYCSPLNGWHDNGEQGKGFPQQQHIHVETERIITNDVERILREIVICCVIFIAGTTLSEHAKVAFRVLEVFLVAWGTSFFIMMMERRRIARITAPPSATFTQNVGQTSLGSKRIALVEKPTPNKSKAYFDEEQASLRRKRSRHEIDHNKAPSPKAQTMESAVSTVSRPQNRHLENLYVMMVGRQERIIPNWTTYDIDTDLFSGKMLLMFRTPDMDEPTKTNDPIVNYFRGKQRRFEFQWQLRLKKIPSGDLFLGVEVDEPIQMGMIQRALANTALKFTKKMNQGFSYCFSDSSDGPSFLSFPVGTSMDRFNATEIGGQLPILGQEITEDSETIKQRKKGAKIQWNTDSVYTMALWSAYADWREWQVLNFPGIRPFSITSLVGEQPIKLTLYTQQNLERQARIPSTQATPATPFPPREIIFTIEVSHATFTTMGCEAQKWMADNAVVSERTTEVNETVVFSAIDTFNRIESFGEEYELDEQCYDDDNYEEDLVDELVDPETNCYLLSGTSVSLSEGTGRYVASGGGYAVLQSSRASIVFERVQPKSKKTASYSSAVIVSGDVVRVQLVDAAAKAVKFLAIHRGWWLRWSSVRPKRNGLFCIHTAEPIGSPVQLDSPFSLNSLRWPHYSVGACLDSSVKYGGRMLGIFKTGRVSANDDVGCGEEDDNEIPADIDVPNKRMMPLLLRAESWPCSSSQSPSKVLAEESRNFRNDEDALPNPISSPTSKHYDADIPAWLEIINRTKRTKQMVYGVRLKETRSGSETNLSPCRMTLKLLTGPELAPVLQLGVEQTSVSPPSPDKWQKRFVFDNRDEMNDEDSFLSSSDDSDSDEEEDDEDDQDDPNNRHFFIAGPNHVSVDHIHETEFHGSDHESKSVVEQGNASSSKTSGDAESSVDLTRRDYIELQADTKCIAGQNDIDHKDSAETRKKNRTKHTAVIGRVAKTVKASTVITGKHVIKQSKNITKGTVNAGRAAGRVLPVSSVVYSKPPRKHEPKGGRVHGRRADKSQMKIIGRAIKNIENTGKISTSLLSGMLLSPDQSCRKMSHILMKLCNVPSIQNSIALLAATNSTEDVAFLRGSAAELGVKPIQPIDPTFDVDSLVARCIYEGHWREELCVLHTKEHYIAFYAPLSKKPSVAVSFDEIMAARACDENSGRSPLPGLFFVAIDTAWKCHYLAFLETKQRESFLSRLNNALFHARNESDPSRSRQVLPELESYRMSLETSLTGTAGKWRAVSTGKNSKHKKQRRVLNGRKMTFDLESIVGEGEDPQKEIASYVENLLKMALSFSPDTLNALESRFIEFLDQACRLRTLPLQDIDFSSKAAFCIFVNLYHLLLQHSLLLAVDGLPTMRSVTHFKRCSCYEIGDEVFSLAELECCVIRGKTSRPAYIKPPFVDAPKKSRPYSLYGLSATDFRINFILNPGDRSHPSGVPVLQEGILDDQLDTTSACFLMSQVQIEKRKRTVFLPRVCDVYALDFGMGDGLVCLSLCLKYLDEQSQMAIADLLENGVVSVKFNCVSEYFHPSLTELLC